MNSVLVARKVPVFLYAVCCVLSSSAAEPVADWHLRSIQVPVRMETGGDAGEVVIAIVDDGLRRTHDAVQRFLWRNPKEIPFNQKDDDGNGFIDDVRGWDVADGDAEPDPPAARLEEFSHGTHLAGVITGVISAALGTRASERVRLVPVKALSDYAARTYLKSGFEGVAYASAIRADIILCAWSSGPLSPEQAGILQEASRRGAFIVASAGNFPENREAFPAAHGAVFAVAALDDRDRKSADSNYGTFVDLSAPGRDIRGADSRSDDGFVTKTGTSQAAAIVAAAAALVKLRNPDFTAYDLKVALKASAEPLPEDNPLFLARLGSGKLNVAAAVEARFLRRATAPRTEVRRPQGYLRYAGAGGRSAIWDIAHPGAFKGCWFRLERLDGAPGSGLLTVVSRRGGRVDNAATRSFPLRDLDGPVFVPSQSSYVMFFPDESAGGVEWLIDYRLEPVHLPTLYCGGTKSLAVPGEIEDGSGPQDYSPRTSCFWHIKAPAGKLIRFHFTEFDTESERDLLYLFDGAKTNEKVLAILSGRDIPGELTSRRNEALLWFVTDSQNQAGGWKARFEFVASAGES